MHRRQTRYLRPISIHALREEGDQGRWWTAKPCCSISIHALREEGDRRCPTIHLYEEHFYPRPPRGGRHEFCGSHAAVV